MQHEPGFINVYEAQKSLRGIFSASLCSLAGRHDKWGCCIGLLGWESNLGLVLKGLQIRAQVGRYDKPNPTRFLSPIETGIKFQHWFLRNFVLSLLAEARSLCRNVVHLLSAWQIVAISGVRDLFQPIFFAKLPSKKCNISLIQYRLLKGEINAS